MLPSRSSLYRLGYLVHSKLKRRYGGRLRKPKNGYLDVGVKMYRRGWRFSGNRVYKA